jgi:hypothetical protein
MGRRMRGDETYNLKLKYGISIDITYCSHRLFEKKKESLTLSRCPPLVQVLHQASSLGVASKVTDIKMRSLELWAPRLFFYE